MALTTPTNDLTGNTIASTYGQILFIDGTAITNSALFAVACQDGETALHVANDQILIKDSSGTDIASCFEVQDKDGTICLSVNGTNNRVGIGLAAPAGTLQVGADASDSQIYISNYGLLDYVGSDGAISLKSKKNIWFVINSDSSGSGDHVAFSNASTELVRIIADGNVGIGVTDPDATLEILDTTTQLKLSYDATNYASFSVAADGLLNIVTDDPGGAEADICLNPDGNVGIGTTTPDDPLTIVSGSVDEYTYMNIQNSSAHQFLKLGIKASVAHICYDDGDSLAIGEMTSTGETDITTARLIIDTNGRVGIATSVPGAQLQVGLAGADTDLSLSNYGGLEYTNSSGYITLTSKNNVQIQYDSDANNSGEKITFTHHASTEVGKFADSGDFYTNDSSVSGLSDVRVKKDIIDLSDGLSIINQLRPRTFKYNGKASMAPDDGVTRYGFIADEVLTVAPQYISIGMEEVDGVDVNDFKSLAPARFIPMMINAIKELSTKVTALENA